MQIIIRETGVGVTGSNCYTDLETANNYFESCLHANTWNSANSTNQTKALIHATSSIDSYLQHNGEKVCTEQSLEYPRIDYGNSIYQYSYEYLIFPEKELKKATAEFAQYLLQENPFIKNEFNGIAEIEVVDVVRIKTQAKTEDIIPDFVYKILSKYCTRKGGTRNIRTCRG